LIIQQLREAFPFEASHKYLILDRDQKFGFDGGGSSLSVEERTPRNEPSLTFLLSSLRRSGLRKYPYAPASPQVQAALELSAARACRAYDRSFGSTLPAN
jgi:hypothetical protein